MPGAPQPAAPIAAVERETGIAKETLRVWERRYGFPKPLRDAHGERLYPHEQVQRLRLVRRLLDKGMRPGTVLRASEAELRAHLCEHGGAGESGETGAPAHSILVAELTRTLQQHELGALQQRLSTALMRLGIQRFVVEVAAPMNVAIGSLWAQGSLSVAEEHLYTELMQQLLRASLRNEGQPSRPRVLLTTLPGEEHALGLLMAHAWLAAEGVDCVALGTETPCSDIAWAAEAHRVDVVGLSFSSIQVASSARAQLTELRSRLSPRVAIWTGGTLWLNVRRMPAGVERVATWDELGATLAAWRCARGVDGPPA